MSRTGASLALQAAGTCQQQEQQQNLQQGFNPPCPRVIDQAWVVDLLVYLMILPTVVIYI
jgi:hypothetical protein